MRCIELPGFLAGAGGELSNHILVGVTQDINILCFAEAEINTIQCNKHVTDKTVLVIGGFAELRRSQVNIGEKATEVIATLVAYGAVFNLFQTALQLGQDILLVADTLNDGRVQELRLDEIAKVFHADALDFRFQFFLVRGPGLLEGEAVLAELVVDVQLNLLGEVLVENESEGKIHEVTGAHVSTEFIGNVPKLGTESLLQFFAHISVYVFYSQLNKSMISRIFSTMRRTVALRASRPIFFLRTASWMISGFSRPR